MTDPIHNDAVNLTEAANRDHQQPMTSDQLIADLGHDFRTMIGDAIRDSKLEVRHIIDPSQCGFVVRRHFDALIFAILGFVAGSMFVACLAILLYGHMHR